MEPNPRRTRSWAHFRARSLQESLLFAHPGRRNGCAKRICPSRAAPQTDRVLLSKTGKECPGIIAAENSSRCSLCHGPFDVWEGRLTTFSSLVSREYRAETSEEKVVERPSQTSNGPRHREQRELFSAAIIPGHSFSVFARRTRSVWGAAREGR